MKLPPPGSDPALIAEYVDRLVREAAMNQRRQDAEVEWDRAINLYQGAHFTTAPQEGAIRVVLNRVLTCIVSQMAIQAGDPPKILFSPRETGEPPLYYLNTNLPEGQKIGEDITAQAAMAQQPWDVNQPLPDADVEILKGQVAQGQQATAMAAAAGMPPPPGLIPPEIMVEVSDRTAAEALQTIFDAQWEAQDLQIAFGENVLNKNIFGHQPTLYEFDDDLKRHILTNIHVKQVFFDPIRTDVARMQYVIYDEPISADEAIALYPWLKEDIDASFKEGQPLRPGSGNYSPATQYQQAFLREMGYLRHAWIRSQPYPMTPDEAEAAGHITISEVADESGIGQQAGNIGSNPNPILQSQRTIGTGGTGGSGIPAIGAGTGTAGADLEPEALPVEMPPVPTRTAFIHQQTGEELTPTLPGPDLKPIPHPKWPMRYSVRQLRIIAGKCVDDRENEFADIPIHNNINLEVPYSPYGMGEPDRLDGLQMALNYVLSAIVTHQRYNAYPPEVVAESVVAMMDEALKNCRAKPGQRITVPDTLLTQFQDIKKIITTLDVAALPADFWKLLQFLVEMIDKEGNQSDVMSGNASPGWSGDAIASLQNAASQVIKAKSMWTEFWLRRIVRDMAHSIINRMGPKDWLRYCSKYPVQAMQSLHDKAKSLECDISVQIQSGSGAAKQSQTNNLIAARQNQVPISDPEIMERLGVDPDVQVQRQAAFNQKRAALMPQMPAAPQGQEGQGAEKKGAA